MLYKTRNVMFEHLIERNVTPNYISHEALRVARESVEKRLRLRIQTWQRHHGLSEPLRESDERGENVHAAAAGESNRPPRAVPGTPRGFWDAPGGYLC